MSNWNKTIQKMLADEQSSTRLQPSAEPVAYTHHADRISERILTAIMGEGDGVQEDRDAAIAWLANLPIEQCRMVVVLLRGAEEKAAAAERARIVAWLRGQLDNYLDECPDRWPVIDDIGDLLAAIERGEV